MNKDTPRDMEFWMSTDPKGKASLTNTSLWHDYFRAHPDSKFIVNISKVREKHDAKVRAFYFAARVVPCMQALNGMGYNLNRDEVHLMIKHECPLMNETITLPTGKTVSRTRSLGEECDTGEVLKLIEFVEQWGAENLDIKWD